MTADTQIHADIFQTACGIVMEAKSLKSMLKHKDVVDAIAAALAAERARHAQPRKKIIDAMCELPHSIDDSRVEFRFSPSRNGHNALNQLITALEVQFGTSKEEA
jgi:hypothetical protein